ncbi:telethonin [Cololabis saira]|uniref:telethonin n=1 Tax=Cololabis saira TaxID=129043 RepID=UPI002AD23A3B|nr:telethonin [Cololabis saira]
MHCVSTGGSDLVNSYGELQEDNHWKKESYHSCWLSLVLQTRPQYKLTLSETDSIRRESYKQQQAVHFLVETGPGQKMVLGVSGGAMTTHRSSLFHADPQHATARTADPFTPRKEESDADQQEVPAVTQDVIKPVRVNFRASSLMSSPREICHRGQRRE